MPYLSLDADAEQNENRAMHEILPLFLVVAPKVSFPAANGGGGTSAKFFDQQPRLPGLRA
jgi:hypothetical protein